MNKLEHIILITALLGYTLKTIWRLHGRFNAILSIELFSILMQSADEETSLIVSCDGETWNGFHHWIRV